MSALPGSSFISDCKVIVDSMKLGRHAAVGGGSSHARIYALLFAVFDDIAAELLIWMPAHQGNAKGATRCKSDGTALTQLDVETNDLADRLAKRGVEEHRVPYRVRKEWERCLAEATARARWIARATHEANNMEAYPFSDFESSKKAAEEAKRKRRDDIANGTICVQPRGRKANVDPRPPSLGGHLIVHVVRGGKPASTCSLCRTTSTKKRQFAAARCSGSAASKWAKKAVLAAERDTTTGPGQQRLVSGDVGWCRICGCYADAMARGLAASCKGKPLTTNSGGRPAQLRWLRAGLHPLTRERLPPAIDEQGKCMVYDRSVVVGMERMSAIRAGKGISSAIVYPSPTASSYTSGSSVAVKMQARLDRARTKERQWRQPTVMTQPFHMRGKQKPPPWVAFNLCST